MAGSTPPRCPSRAVPSPRARCLAGCPPASSQSGFTAMGPSWRSGARVRGAVLPAGHCSAGSVHAPLAAAAPSAIGAVRQVPSLRRAALRPADRGPCSAPRELVAACSAMSARASQHTTWSWSRASSASGDFGKDTLASKHVSSLHQEVEKDAAAWWAVVRAWQGAPWASAAWDAVRVPWRQRAWRAVALLSSLCWSCAQCSKMKKD